MASYFLDSSAVIKLYQLEEGSAVVERILSEKDTLCFIARLTLVEVQRALARRLRTREISAQELDELRRGFYEDLLRRRFRVKELTSVHYRSAVRLVRQYAPQRTVPLLRSPDALQLAVALNVRQQHGLDYFVAADGDLCKVAEAEQLRVINPAP
jgi:PIN domain nuclease of toxin-antitoxin system